MAGINGNSNLLYCYLRTLSVKVSRITMHRLLDNPQESSMRGISDALDTLRIKNAVYQLPSRDYFSQLNVPFITTLQVQKDPFCVVMRKTESTVELISEEGKKHTIGTDRFLQYWTGIVLIGEVSEDTLSDPFYICKNIAYFLFHYRFIISILLLFALGIQMALHQLCSPVLVTHLCILLLGVMASIGIIYKENFNENFLEKFCHIGEVVNCNQVLQSRGANIAGVGLGELALLYFSTIFFFTVLCVADFYFISVICCIATVGFTVYSIIYQIFILQTVCVLCMLVNLSIWGNVLTLFLMRNSATFSFSFISLFTFIFTGCIYLILGMILSSYHQQYKERFQLKKRLATLLKPITFRRLLELEVQMKELPSYDIMLNNHHSGDNRLLVITNPNCKNCANAHSYIKELSATIPVSLMLLTFPGDKPGKQIADMITETYIQKGWEAAMQLLEIWFDKQNPQGTDVEISFETKEIRKKQQMYCLQQNISQTPSFFIDGYHVPEVCPTYTLKYVLT